MILDANPTEVDYAELERKQDLTVLMVLEEVAPEFREAYAVNQLGMTSEEYHRLQRKYRVVLARYREEQNEKN